MQGQKWKFKLHRLQMKFKNHMRIGATLKLYLNKCIPTVLGVLHD